MGPVQPVLVSNLGAIYIVPVMETPASQRWQNCGVPAKGMLQRVSTASRRVCAQGLQSGASAMSSPPLCHTPAVMQMQKHLGFNVCPGSVPSCFGLILSTYLCCFAE